MPSLNSKWPMTLRRLHYHFVKEGMDTIVAGPAVLKISDRDPLTCLTQIRASGELQKNMFFFQLDRTSEIQTSGEHMQANDKIEITDMCSELAPEAALNELYRHISYRDRLLARKTDLGSLFANGLEIRRISDMNPPCQQLSTHHSYGPKSIQTLFPSRSCPVFSFQFLHSRR